MYTIDDLMISTRDAEGLALMLGDRNRRAEHVGDLVAVLQMADIVPDDRLPDDRVAMDRAVTYQDTEGGEPRRIVLVWPANAAPEDGLVSVLTPVGTALLGRSVDDEAEVALPNGRGFTVRIVAVDRASEQAAVAAGKQKERRGGAYA